MIPLWIKISYTLYIVILVPVYWVEYGPANFLWFSDLAFLTLGVALWLESPLLASMMAVGTLVAELVWNLDFFLQLFTDRTLFNIAGYMYNHEKPLHLRALSGFHLLLPPMELWLVYRLGYVQKAWKVQMVIACMVVIASRLASDEKLNVNWVYGPGHRQTLLPDGLYVALVALTVVFGVIVPGHLMLQKWFGRRSK